MTLLVSKKCKACWMVEGVEKKYKNIHKFYVEDDWVNVNGLIVHLDPAISELPCLIDDKNYVFRADTILAYLKQVGELNARTNIL